MDNPAPATGRLDALIAFARDPLKLRLAIAAALLAGWYFAAFGPLVARIEETGRRVDAERARLALAREIDALRAEAGRLKGHLPEQAGRDEWVQFVMDGVRRRPLRLVAIEPQTPVEVGPYRAVPIRLTVEGPYAEVEGLLRWMETAPRLVRVDQIRIVPGKQEVRRGGPSGAPKAEMQVVVLGVVG